MDRALRWAVILFAGFLVVTQQVITNGPLVAYDKEINSQPKPQFSGFAGFFTSTEVPSLGPVPVLINLLKF